MSALCSNFARNISEPMTSELGLSLFFAAASVLWYTSNVRMPQQNREIGNAIAEKVLAAALNNIAASRR